jgi:hypothetical protein
MQIAMIAPRRAVLTARSAAVKAEQQISLTLSCHVHTSHGFSRQYTHQE